MDLDTFAVRLRSAGSALHGPEMKQVMGVLGDYAVKDAATAARNDLGGDLKFSGWKRTDDLTVDYRHSDPGEIVVAPPPRTRGPWVVAELGRGHGNASGFQGPGIQRKTGLTSRTKSGAVRKVRTSKARKWSGYTDPLHTFSDAKKVMRAEHTKRAAIEVFGMLRGEILDGR